MAKKKPKKLKRLKPPAKGFRQFHFTPLKRDAKNIAGNIRAMGSNARVTKVKGVRGATYWVIWKGKKRKRGS